MHTWEITNHYTPHNWQIEKDTVYAAITAITSGIEYAQECLAQHDTALGRTTRKNKTWAETIEKDIRQMTRALEQLQNCREESVEIPPP
jgi:hypothetical protein